MSVGDTPDRRLIAVSWEIFANAALPPQVTVAQRVGMRQAYFAGAAAVVALLTHRTEVIDGEADVTPILGVISEEINAWAEGLGVDPSMAARPVH